MDYLRISLAVTVVVVLIVSLVTVNDLFDGPESSTAAIAPDTFVESPEAIARAQNRDHPGQGRGPRNLPPPFAASTTAAETVASSTSPSSSTTSALSSSTTSTAPKITTTSSGTTPTTDATGGTSEGTISGSACPCTVTGTVELKGNVSLNGDITVMGGTLVARPGVSVDGNGHQILIMDGGRADIQGSPVFTWSGNGSNANLTRDIVFSNLRRIMFHGASKSTLKYFTVVDSGTPALGDYPLHWHLNGDSVRGTVVEGVVVRNGANHAFVPHGSHGITFKDVIAKNTRKTAFWWDAPGTNDCSTRDRFCTADNSNGIVYDHALVDGVYETQGNTEYHRVSGFLLNAGSGNVIRNSVVRNVEGGKDCSGFHWPGAANQNVGGNVWVAHGLSVYDDDCHAVFVWQNDGNSHVVSGVTGRGIGHGAYVNHYEYVDFAVDYVHIHAAGWKMRDGSIDQLVAHRHLNTFDPTFEATNVTIGTFTISNGSGDIPGIYVFENTTLTCGEVIYKDVLPGTRVIIDGEDC